MDKKEHEQLEILDAIKNLAALIEQSTDPDRIIEYIHQLAELRNRLIASGPVRKPAEQP